MKCRRAIQAQLMPSKQEGAAILGTVLVLLVIVSLVSIAASKSTILETKMVFNMQDKQRSSLAADSSAIFAWNQVKADMDKEAIIGNGDDGYYVLTNAFPVDATAKTSTHWDDISNVSDWPWGDSAKSSVMSEPIGGTSNPMKLVANPQYSVGIHDAAFRKGTSNYKCIPVSIIGASQGATETTRTLIEIKSIPKSGCFHEKIK